MTPTVVLDHSWSHGLHLKVLIWGLGQGLEPIWKEYMTDQKAVFNFKDWAERTAWTAAQSFLAIFVVTDLSTLKAAATAGIAAVLAAVKTLAQQRFRG